MQKIKTAWKLIDQVAEIIKQAETENILFMKLLGIVQTENSSDQK